MDALQRVLNPFLLQGDSFMHRAILVPIEKRMPDRCALLEIWHLYRNFDCFGPQRKISHTTPI